MNYLPATYILMTVLLQMKTLHGRIALSNLKESPRKQDIKVLLDVLKNLEKPKKMERNLERLKRLLGNNFNPYFTSINKPDLLKARQPSSILEEDTTENIKMKSFPQMNAKLRNMKFFVKKENGKRKEFGKKVTQKFQRWLWNLSRCPVRYKWIDIGENIFPRFIKLGACSKKKTCSFPAGMKCIKSGWKTVDVLLYTCPNSNINSVTSTCQWRPMRLDILTACKCGCSD